MARFKATLKKLFCLPPLPTVFIAVPSFIFVFLMLATGRKTPLTYLAYLVSAYGMVIAVTGFMGVVAGVRNGFDSLPLLQKIRKNPLGARLLGDDVFRAKLSLQGGLLINLLYVGLNLFSGLRYRSGWFVALAVYYLLLSVMRASLVQYVHKKPLGLDIPGELRRYRLCGVFLLFMNQALIGIVVTIVYQNKGFVYSGLLIYAMAAYTFWLTILAIINVIKYRRRGSPILSATKIINLTAALVSMLSLETAMLAQFSPEQQEFRRVMTAASGGGVCILVLLMAVSMLISSTKRIQSARNRPQG